MSNFDRTLDLMRTSKQPVLKLQPMEMTMWDVAITGTGIVSALGCSVDEYTRRILAGEIGIQKAPWKSPNGRDAWWAQVTDFRPGDWMSEQVEDGTDLFSQYAIAAASQALTQSGLTKLNPERTAVVHGCSMGGMRGLMKAQHLLDTVGPEAVPRKTEIQIYPNMAAAQLAMKHQLHGPLMTITTACAASFDAIGFATKTLASGEADVALVGATDGAITGADGGAEGNFVPALFYTRTLYGMEAPSNDPYRAMLPFDVKRSGIVLGDGSGFFVLERGKHARARGANILGYVRGFASLADAYHPSAPDPSGRWEARAMTLALRSAGMTIEDVDALIAHATGTPKGDTAEIRAINEVYGARSKWLPVSAIKGHTGHTGAATGAMALIAGLHGMATDRFGHIAGTDEPDPEARFEIVIKQPKPMKINTLQINAFGFGGQNSSLIVTRN